MRCARCGYEQPERDECAQCGVVFSKFDPDAALLRRGPSADDRRRQRIAGEYARRAKKHNWIATRVALPLIAASFLAGAFDAETTAGVVFALGFAFLLATSWFLLRCPACDRSIGDPSRSFCPRCDALLRPVHVQRRADVAVVSDFRHRHARLIERRPREFVVGMIVFVPFVALMSVDVPPWLERTGGVLFALLVVAAMAWSLLRTEDYSCPRCRKPLFEDANDGREPILDPEFCPFCGTRFTDAPA